MPVKIIPTSHDADVTALLARATTSDGIPPISDGLLDAAAEESSLTLGAYDGRDLVGWAVAAWQGTRGAAELVVDPTRRGRGSGAELVAAVRETLSGHPGPGLAEVEEAEAAAAPAAKAPGADGGADETAGTGGQEHASAPLPPLGQTWFWSHGDHPAAAHMAAQLGYARERELLQLHTDDVNATNPHALPEPVVPAGVELRGFRPGDEDGWRRVNNAAFDWHPEQGGQSAQDYRDIVSAPGFNPDDVIFAVDAASGDIIGFHETKLHPDHPSGKLVGEVYVIGVDPATHARGIGRALTVAGMRHMFEQGAQLIELYVESDNVPALRLYESLGFSHRIVHVSYAPPAASDAPPAAADATTDAASHATSDATANATE